MMVLLPLPPWCFLLSPRHRRPIFDSISSLLARRHPNPAGASCPGGCCQEGAPRPLYPRVEAAQLLRQLRLHRRVKVVLFAFQAEVDRNA